MANFCDNVSCRHCEPNELHLEFVCGKIPRIGADGRCSSFEPASEKRKESLALTAEGFAKARAKFDRADRT